MKRKSPLYETSMEYYESREMIWNLFVWCFSFIRPDTRLSIEKDEKTEEEKDKEYVYLSI